MEQFRRCRPALCAYSWGQWLHRATAWVIIGAWSSNSAECVNTGLLCLTLVMSVVGGGYLRVELHLQSTIVSILGQTILCNQPSPTSYHQTQKIIIVAIFYRKIFFGGGGGINQRWKFSGDHSGREFEWFPRKTSQKFRLIFFNLKWGGGSLEYFFYTS